MHHTHKLLEYTIYANVDAALKQLLLAALEPQYISTSASTITGFGRISTTTILQHLRLTYYNIEPIHLHHNKQTMAKPFDIHNHFEYFVTQIEDAVAFSIAGNSPSLNNKS